MVEDFNEILAVGGKSNSLGRVNDVIEIVLHDKGRLKELYDCLLDDNAWVRMRAADAIEKICRQHPEWLVSYIDKFQAKFATNSQASIQWHLAQIYRQVDLTNEQKQNTISWLFDLLSNTEVDWIVAANAMDTLVQFTQDGNIPKEQTIAYIKIQQKHKSKSVVKRANKLLAAIDSN